MKTLRVRPAGGVLGVFACSALLLLQLGSRTSSAVPAAAPDSLVWDDGARSLCFQHLSQTREGAEGQEAHDVSSFKGTACGDLGKRPRQCGERGAVFKRNPFMTDGTCPAWFTMTYNWTIADKGKPVGWDFQAEPAAGDGSPLLMRLSNRASGATDPCEHHEVNFAYNFPGINFKSKDGRPVRVSDYDDVVLSFDARLVEATKSKCASLPRNVVKISFVLRWYDPVKRGKPLWQSSIAVIIYDNERWFDKVEAENRAKGKPDVAYWNKCGIHAAYKTGSCMLSLTGDDERLPELNDSFQSYRVSLTKLMQERRSFLEPRGKASRLRLEDAEIKSVQLISAVNGADVVFDLKDTRLLGLDH